MAQKRQDFLLVKVVLVGNSAVGKTNIMLRFTEMNYKMNHISTIGVDFKVKTVKTKTQNVKMQLWDTAGQDKFRNLTGVYYRKASAVVFVYSVTDRQSFNDVVRWMTAADNVQKIRCQYIIGNKSDARQDRVVSFEEGERLANDYKCKFMETSAKEGTNINQIFQIVAEDLQNIDKLEGKLVNLEKIDRKKQKCEC